MIDRMTQKTILYLLHHNEPMTTDEIANEIPRIRVAVGHDVLSIERSIKSNNCQILCMGARVIAPEYALLLVQRWLTCAFCGGTSAKK